MIDVPHRPNVHVRLRALEFLLSHTIPSPSIKSFIDLPWQREPSMGLEPMTPFLPRTCSTG
jgi:hypothetical protein